MSRMPKDALGRRARRQFSEEFKDGAVRLVLDEGKTIGAVARELDLTASALAIWVQQARAERTHGKSGLLQKEREELTRLRKEVRELRMEREVLKKAAAFFAKDYRRGYYRSPRVQDDLVEWGERVSRKRTIRLMQEEGLKARVRTPYKVTTDSDHNQPIAANLLQREFTAERPNQRWAGDTSELVIGESGRLYLAVILDMFSRFVVGWAVSACNDRPLTIKALEMALKRRCPEFGLLHHSDQDATYASEDSQRILAARGIVCSMSRRGNHYNAGMEAFFATRKGELGERFDSNGEAKMQLFDYIEVFYNQRRRQSSVGRTSPAECERRAAAA